MKYLGIFALLALACSCTTQTGVRTVGSPHMVNKATGNAVLAIMIKDLESTQDAAKAQSVDALKGSVAATGSGNADSTATVAPEVITVPTVPPAPENLEDPLPAE